VPRRAPYPAPQERQAPEPAAVAAVIVAHYRREHRDLPWRRSRDPYAIWVSEIMLQQTRVATVMPYFERWLERFPTVTALAQAPLDDVLAAWAGLGYYRRARNLHRGAADVVARYDGRLPATATELRSISGVGRYTAGAVASIAFDQCEPVVDGNVMRVLARVFAIDDDIKSASTQRRFWSLAGAMVPAAAPGDFNQGIMELGATVCTPTSPSCLVCPLSSLCRARAEGRQAELPVVPARRAAAELPLIAEAAAWIVRRGRLLLLRRRAEGLFGGLWELPQAARRDALEAAIGVPITLLCESPSLRHRQTLSHRRLAIAVWPARLGRGRVRPASDRYDRFRWQPLDALDARALSAGTRAIAARLAPPP
jgi:A/G-specific adenine glycosylase